jgi:peptide/nickel transport system ATP-binding protein
MGSIIVPESGLRDVKLTAIPGAPPNLKNPPAGCRFAERCKFVRLECKVISVAIRRGSVRAGRLPLYLTGNELRDLS